MDDIKIYEFRGNYISQNSQLSWNIGGNNFEGKSLDTIERVET